MENPPVHITQKAIAEIKKIIEKKQIPANYMLRLGVKGGGCGVPTFFVAFDTQKEKDLIYTLENDNFSFLIEKGHLMYLLDVTLGYEERRTEQGFVFRKPNEKG